MVGDATMRAGASKRMASQSLQRRVHGRAVEDGVGAG